MLKSILKGLAAVGAVGALAALRAIGSAVGVGPADVDPVIWGLVSAVVVWLVNKAISKLPA